MSAASIIIIKRAKYIRIFKQARATAPRQAIIPEEYGIRKSIIFNKLVRDGIIIPVHDRYYLDERKEGEIKKGSQKLLFILAGIIILIMILSLLGQTFWS